MADQLLVGDDLLIDSPINNLHRYTCTPFLRFMLQIETDLSRPAVTSLDRSEVMIIPVTEALLLRVSSFWLRAIENMLIFLS